MWSTVLAVVGTLAGSALSGVLQHRAVRAERAAERAADRHRARVDVVSALAVALSDHRRAMWEVRDAELTEQEAERVRALRAESHRTRSAITEPAVRLRLLIANAAVRVAAERAIKNTYGMRAATDVDDLEARRFAALTSHDAFVDAAGAHLI